MMKEGMKMEYISGEEKIMDESKQSVELTEEIVRYISRRCEEDLSYNALVVQKNKSWKKCFSYMMEKARKLAQKGSSGIMVNDTTLFQWIDEYYHLNEAEKEEKRKVNNVEKKEHHQRNQIKEKAKDITAATEDTEIDGQIHLFSMLTK